MPIRTTTFQKQIVFGKDDMRTQMKSHCFSQESIPIGTDKNAVTVKKYKTPNGIRLCTEI